jgi:hypothetical protein
MTCGIFSSCTQRPPAYRRAAPENHRRRVRAHIDAIEKSLGTALFVQHAQGYELTPAGEALLKHAEAMENVALLAEDELTHSAAPWARSASAWPKAWG